MLKTGIVVILALILAANTIHLDQHTLSLRAGKVNLIADNGKYLSICNKCGNSRFPYDKSYDDSASLSSGASKSSVWTIAVYGPYVSFKGSNGKYLSYCRACWVTSYGEAVFVNLPHDDGIESLWIPTPTKNGKYVFQSISNGKFLARCNKCVSDGKTDDFAFVNISDSSIPQAQWTVKYV